ncbi:hypothetical protein, partial [Acidomonas methanolica]
MSETQTAPTSVAPNDPVQITLEKIRGWHACAEGRDWFRAKFPQGGTYGDVMTALYADKRISDAWWLANAAFDVETITTRFIEEDVRSIIAATKFKISANEAEPTDADRSDDGAQAGFSGDDAR